MKYKNKYLQISCDGGAATGKSTGAKMIAKKYNLKFLSSGLLYRYASYLILKFKPRNRISFLKGRFKKLNYYQLNKINLNNPKISEHSASIAKINKIRAILKKYQLNFSKKYKNCCIEGRDISTKILPNSDVKFFFTSLLSDMSHKILFGTLLSMSIHNLNTPGKILVFVLKQQNIKSLSGKFKFCLLKFLMDNFLFFSLG